MDSLAISWLVASASSPLVAVLALWTIYVFHTYRRRWRTVDLFLLAICSQELVHAVLAFCLAIVSLINAPIPTPCTFIRWGLVSTRTFQVATLVSMVVDRSLTVRWPYRYRFSVRRNQIRYHIAVLAVVSALTGTAAYFATSSGDDSGGCHLHPIQWDIRYALFLLCLHGLLVAASFVCMIQVEVHRCRNGTEGEKVPGSFQLPECVSPDLPSANNGMNSPLDTQSSTGSTRALHRPSRQASRRPYGKNNKGTSDLRWPSVAITSLLCLFINHIPCLVVMSLAVWRPMLWSSWHEAVMTWLGLTEGLLVPLLLFCRDPALRNALRRAFQRRSGALSPLVGDDGPFQMYFDKDHFRKRGTFGSVTPVGIITNYRRTPGGKRGRKESNAKYTLPGLHAADSVLAQYRGSEPLSKLSCADLTSLEMWREEEEENFYATLSDDFSTFSCKSADDSALSEDMRISEELYGGSFTTVANDDFEFHDTRPCGGEVRMKPALVSPATPPTVSRNTSFRGNITTKIETSFVPQTRGLVELEENGDGSIYKNPDLFILPPNGWNNEDGLEQCQIVTPLQSPPHQNVPNNKFRTISRKSTSFSMNDLDLIHRKRFAANQITDIEATFMLPVKSESTMSLYRLNVEQDMNQMALTPSKSENNVNGDSGFGSGAQSTNPVWSGFLCRKPSDPFWNIRKPTSGAATPTRNYPGILHPRMRKIPWISAWKKLDENSIYNERRHIPDSPVRNALPDWKENLVYESSPQTNNTCNNLVSTIDEELSDVGSPIYCNPDYNLNIFAKQSGVVMENAYGKIVRDDCGVKVNFYGKNSHEGVDNNQVPLNHFNNSFETTNQLSSHQVNDSLDLTFESQVSEDPLKVLNSFDDGNNVFSTTVTKAQPQSNRFSNKTGDAELEFKTQLDDHYENLFGTKENIFSHCERYRDRQRSESSSSDNRPVRKGSFRNNNSEIESKSSYGKLNKVMQPIEAENKSPFKIKEFSRRESGGKSGLKRRSSSGKYDRNPSFFKETNIYTSFLEIGGKMNETSPKNTVEIEMKNVSNNCDIRFNKLENNINFLRQNGIPKDDQKKFKSDHRSSGRTSSGSNEYKPSKLPRSDSRNKGNESFRERKFAMERRQNGRKLSDKDMSRHIDFPSRNIPISIERRESAKLFDKDVIRKPVERRNSDRQHKPVPPKLQNISDDKKSVGNEGLWATAIPFDGPIDNKYEENGNSPQKEIRKDVPLKRSPKKSNLPRRDSSNRNEPKSNVPVRRKTSKNRGKNNPDSDSRGLWDGQNRAWNRPKSETNYNFDFAQNEVSAEKRIEQMLSFGKPNGNIQNIATCSFPEDKYTTSAELPRDNNDNCPDKMTIADFL